MALGGGEFSLFVLSYLEEAPHILNYKRVIEGLPW